MEYYDNNMEYYDKEYCLEVWGDLACFTRPEFKVERVSYEVITPSAVRAIFEAIFWKPAIRWEVTRIEVLSPIRTASIRRNEVGATANTRKRHIYIEDYRQQKSAIMLRDVKYRIYARQVFVPVDQRKTNHKPDSTDENPGKYHAMFERRARNGQCFNQPYLGTRECSASFRLIESAEENNQPSISESRDLGLMLYDMDFSNPRNIKPIYYHPTMINGTIEVPSPTSDKLIR